MVNLILLVALFLVTNLATMKIEMSDGSFYRPIAEMFLCVLVIVVVIFV